MPWLTAAVARRLDTAAAAAAVMQRVVQDAVLLNAARAAEAKARGLPPGAQGVALAPRPRGRAISCFAPAHA